MTQKALILDASALINILGTGAERRLLDGLGGVCEIEENTVKEVTRNPADGQPAGPSISALTRSRCLTIRKMSDTSYAKYIELVAAAPDQALGRGESAALAYAAQVGGIVVLDDQKARRIGQARFPACEQVTSAWLFKRAADGLGLNDKQIGELLVLARTKARMHVLARDEAWVNRCISRANA